MSGWGLVRRVLKPTPACGVCFTLGVLADNARCQERLTGAIETLERAVRERGFGQ